MILFWLILFLMFTGFLAWFSGIWSSNAPRWISLSGLILGFLLMIRVWIMGYSSPGTFSGEKWMLEYRPDWIPQFGISFHLALDGLSLLLLLLTFLLGILAVLISWKEIDSRSGFFHFNLMFLLAGISGVFIAMDLFLFYFFWEVMLIPMYFIIAMWGHEHRIYAAYKFFLFTQGSGLLMLLSILGIYFIHAHNTGVYSFDISDLAGFSASPAMTALLMAGFLLAFAVKLPVVPFHTWLPDAHTEAPTAGSLVLAGLMLKTGAYGMIRYIIPLFHDLSVSIAPYAMIVGVAGVLYGAKLAFAQTDLKRLVAYTSVSHMGFIVLGIYSFNEIAMKGVVMQIVAHALSTGALFIIAGIIQERIHTRDLDKMGGLWSEMPGLGSLGMVFAMASLGLPGLANFVAEFMILLGSYQSIPVFSILASLGLIASAIYALWMVQKVFFGHSSRRNKLADLNLREVIILGALLIPLVYFGLYPGPLFKTLGTPVDATSARSSVLPRVHSANDTFSFEDHVKTAGKKKMMNFSGVSTLTGKEANLEK